MQRIHSMETNMALMAWCTLGRSKLDQQDQGTTLDSVAERPSLEQHRVRTKSQLPLIRSKGRTGPRCWSLKEGLRLTPAVARSKRD
jgi:formylmethanofuran dehydrogenase subunit E